MPEKTEFNTGLVQPNQSASSVRNAPQLQRN